MSNDKIPPIDQDVSTSKAGDDGIENYEAAILAWGAKTRNHILAEAKQRYWLKWIVLALCFIVILCMTFLLSHIIHKSFWGPFMTVSPSFAVAMIVTPIVSITSISIFLLIGAFRKFDEKDMSPTGALNTASGAAKTYGNLG